MRYVWVFCLLLLGQGGWGAQQGMDYFRSSAPERLLGQDGEIRLVTWNILGLPNDQVAVRPWEERIDGIAQTLLTIDAEVVILQECFEPQLSMGLMERLKGRYPHAYLHLEDASTPLPSGLALFSKLPVADFEFLPHPDLLDTERNSKMGIMKFILLNASHLPIAHIAASHFQGSSNCEWRIGLTESGARLSYAEVREQEGRRLLALSPSCIIPQYICGDLNVDRRSKEYEHSILNEANNQNLVNPMSAEMKVRGTNTNFWKHEKGIAKLYPHLTPEHTLQLALHYEQFYIEKLQPALAKEPWNRPLAEFDLSYFDQLEEELYQNNLKNRDFGQEALRCFDPERMVWEYFKVAAVKAIVREKELWAMNRNQGDVPAVSIGRVVEIRALPIEESLDYVLGVGEMAGVRNLHILQGYAHESVEKTLSDHHPVVATIRVACAGEE
jgi:endonuclease/exonuclease/phosphatase family metal-dependent hydrolase